MNQAYAGEYLKQYEGIRYSFTEWALKLVDTPYSIIVPTLAEEFGDVSFYQAPMQWSVYKQHARLVIIRIGQNVWIDSEFEFNYMVARQQGLALGGYFFFDDRVTPQQQADLIISAMRGKHFEGELFIDWETSYGGKYGGLKNVVALMKLLDAAGLDVKDIGLYTGYYYFTDHSSALTHSAEYQYLSTKPLWLAWYAAASVVKVPAPWLTWAHWQTGTSTELWGQPKGAMDRNKSNNTPAEFTAKYLGGATPPPPPGDPMTIYTGTPKAIVTSNVRIRQARPDGSADPIGTTIGAILPKQVFKADLLTSDKAWIRVTEVNGRTIQSLYNKPYGWSATSTLDYAAVPVTPPPPVDPPPAEDDVMEVYLNGVLKLRVTGVAEEFNA